MRNRQFFGVVVFGLAATVEAEDGREVLFRIPERHHRPAPLSCPPSQGMRRFLGHAFGHEDGARFRSRA